MLTQKGNKKKAMIHEKLFLWNYRAISSFELKDWKWQWALMNTLVCTCLFAYVKHLMWYVVNSVHHLSEGEGEMEQP